MSLCCIYMFVFIVITISVCEKLFNTDDYHYICIFVNVLSNLNALWHFETDLIKQMDQHLAGNSKVDIACVVQYLYSVWSKSWWEKLDRNNYKLIWLPLLFCGFMWLCFESNFTCDAKIHGQWCFVVEKKRFIPALFCHVKAMHMCRSILPYKII